MDFRTTTFKLPTMLAAASTKTRALPRHLTAWNVMNCAVAAFITLWWLT